MMFNATFNNILVISWWSVLLMEETGGPGKNTDLSQVTDKHHIMLYTSSWLRFELTTSVVIGTDYIGSCKSNYHTITTTTAPPLLVFSNSSCNNSNDYWWFLLHKQLDFVLSYHDTIGKNKWTGTSNQNRTNWKQNSTVFYTNVGRQTNFHVEYVCFLRNSCIVIV